jgi:hypothetical protein
MTDRDIDWGRVVRGGGDGAGPAGHSCDFRENFRAIVKFARRGASQAEVEARVDRLDLFTDEKRVLTAIIAVAVGDRDEAFGPPMTTTVHRLRPSAL